MKITRFVCTYANNNTLVHIYFQGNEQKVYEFVVRHFLACVSQDAQGFETTVEIDVAEERVISYFCLNIFLGKIIIEKINKGLFCIELGIRKDINRWDYYTLHNILLYKSNKNNLDVYGKYVDEGDNPMNNPNIYIM